MNIESETKLEFWAIVELMGHQRMAGWLTTQSIGSTAMVRVDVPEVPGGKAYTRFVNPSAVYAINPCDEATARAAAAAFRPVPVQRWELPQLPATDSRSTTIREHCDDESEYGGPDEDREF